MNADLYGLILAGGRSARMGQPKALLDYHGEPQYRHAAELLEAFCGRVFISCRAAQQDMFSGYEIICDSDIYGDSGPINGILSALTAPWPDGPPPAWFVLACDYPLLKNRDLAQLLAARDTARVATVFANPGDGRPEPLIGIYETSAAPLLLIWLQEGNQSLRVFLERHHALVVDAERPERLVSADTPGDFQRIKHGKSGS